MTDERNPSDTLPVDVDVSIPLARYYLEGVVADLGYTPVLRNSIRVILQRLDDLETVYTLDDDEPKTSPATPFAKNSSRPPKT